MDAAGAYLSHVSAQSTTFSPSYLGPFPRSHSIPRLLRLDHPDDLGQQSIITIWGWALRTGSDREARCPRGYSFACLRIIPLSCFEPDVLEQNTRV